MTSKVISFNRKKKEVGPSDSPATHPDVDILEGDQKVRLTDGTVKTVNDLKGDDEILEVSGEADIVALTRKVVDHVHRLMNDSTEYGVEIDIVGMSIDMSIDGNTFFDDALGKSTDYNTLQWVSAGISSFRMSVHEQLGFEKASLPMLYLDQIIYMLADAIADSKAFTIHSGARELKLILPAKHPKYTKPTVLVVKISI